MEAEQVHGDRGLRVVLDSYDMTKDVVEVTFHYSKRIDEEDAVFLENRREMVLLHACRVENRQMVVEDFFFGRRSIWRNVLV
jgi:hypothetical protein